MLLLMDNVFRFVQAGGEVSGLLGWLPSRVGYQPTLASEVAGLEERIASTAGAAVASIQAVYVPADDFTDPAMTAISAHMDATLVLSRALAAQVAYPAVDPLASTSLLLASHVVGVEHYRLAVAARALLERFRELQDVPEATVEVVHHRGGAREDAAIERPRIFPFPAVREGRSVRRRC